MIMNRIVVFAAVLPLLAACKKDEPAPSTSAPAAATQPSLNLGNLPPPPEGAISGVLKIAPAVADKVKPGQSIYVIARNGATNAAVAVIRLSVPDKWPLAFTLSGSHTMQPGSGLFGKVKLEARVDMDGDAMTKNPGDVVGDVPELVDVPKSDVVLTLDKVL
jgi:cytochrome c-type biogenesis protein CcmH